jgi:hypothetical protein
LNASGTELASAASRQPLNPDPVLRSHISKREGRTKSKDERGEVKGKDAKKEKKKIKGERIKKIKI